MSKKPETLEELLNAITENMTKINKLVFETNKMMIRFEEKMQGKQEPTIKLEVEGSVDLEGDI